MVFDLDIFPMDKFDLIVTCRLGMEKIVASYIKDIDSGVEVLPAPFNFMGLILVAGSRDRYRLADEIKRSVPEIEKIYMMVGAREGVPTGLFRYASYVLDIAPGIVISTDYALASALIALTTVLHEKLSSEREEIEKTLETS